MANTKEQQQAIEIDGSNIIVSAGAGSGKTAVLTQRVIRKILDGVDVDRLLVLTFTNEAASEMKSRIRDAIIENKLDKQLGLLDSAYITTFDSFALSLVKKYAYILNVPSNISIIDSNIITIYKYRVIDKIFDEMYGIDNFNKLVDDFCLKDDASLKKDIINLSNKLDLLIDKEDFINNYFNRYSSDSFINEIINKYIDLIKNNILELNNIYEEFTSYISDDLISKLDLYFKNLFNGNSYEEYVLFTSQSSPRFTKVDESGLDIKEKLKEKIDDIKKLLRFNDLDEIINGIKNTYEYIKVILDIITKLDKEVMIYKDKYGMYEFNDIAHMAIKIVKDNLDIREEVSVYFNEIMVDEYQDTSSIQEEFINLISHNNVYMVGDIKQSIYRFRNANPYIFQDKYNKYKDNDGGIKIDLLKNFRSRSETLFNINEIFNLIMDLEIGNADYIVSHNMVYGNIDYDKEDTGHDNLLEIYNYDKDNFLEYTCEEKELFIISEDINNKIKSGYKVYDKKTRELRTITYSDICIITDRNKYLDKYKKILEYNEIPSVIYMNLILTNDTVIMIIKNLISLVDYVNNNIYDDKFRYLFTSVARSFIFNYTDDMIYQIINNNKYYDDDIIKICKSIDINNPLVDIINKIIYEFKIYDKLTNLHGIDEYIVRISNLIDIASNLSSLGYGISEFINYLDEVINKGLSVEYSVNTSENNAVKIMNIHKSKGLEFSLCYFTGMHNKFTIKEINDKFLFKEDLGIILPYSDNLELKNTILKDLYIDNFYKEEVSEKIRLFYVALTRCREKMIIVTSLDKERYGYDKLVPNDKRIKYRSFLDILNSISIIDKYVKDIEGNYTHKYDEVILKDINNKDSNILINKKNIDIEYNTISKEHFSKGNNDIIDLDKIKVMEYGTSIHESLEYADFNNRDSKYINSLLDKIDNNYINIYREYEFIYEIDNILYNGVIDLMLEYDNYINIIDYKLKNIDEVEYIKQLNGYKEYIESISNKRVDIYLYSLLDNNLRKLN